MMGITKLVILNSAITRMLQPNKGGLHLKDCLIAFCTLQVHRQGSVPENSTLSVSGCKSMSVIMMPITRERRGTGRLAPERMSYYQAADSVPSNSIVGFT